MERKTLGAIAIGIVVLMGIILVVGSAEGGLPKDIRHQFDQEKTLLSHANAEFDKSRSELKALASGKHASWLAPLAERERWFEEITDCEAQLTRAKDFFQAQAVPLFDENKKEDRGKLGTVLSQVESDRGHALAFPQSLLTRTKALIDFAENKDKYVAEAKANVLEIEGFNLVDISQVVQKAQSDWPEKSGDLEKRLSVLTSAPTQAAALGKSIEELATQETAEVDIVDFQSKVQQVSKLKSSTPLGIDTLAQLIDQLYVSYDKILSDMEIREGADVEFYHEYRRISIDRNDATQDTREWVKVSKTDYDRLEQNLGMTIESKPKGHFDSEASKVASPPGYNYVGNSHYGQWENRNGSSFWVFYGRYALMRDLFWGPRMYSPMQRASYNQYRTVRDSGRPYYGQDSSGKKVYGSSGSHTRSSYSNAKYVKSDGFKSSQYRKSGGSYRGSRYASSRSSSSSSSSYRRGSRSSGGSRSFGK